MSSTDGLTRGLEVQDTGAPMMMPVGPETLGRIWNVVGEPVDGKPMPDIKAVSYTHLDPAIRIITAALDEGMNEDAYIVPGLGDAGDRIFNALNV